jgi:hypothetical protein
MIKKYNMIELKNIKSKYPSRVKFIGDKKLNPLYKSGFRKNKIYNTTIDDALVLEIFEELGTVTVINDFGEPHEIEKGDYEIKCGV